MSHIVLFSWQPVHITCFASTLRFICFFFGSVFWRDKLTQLIGGSVLMAACDMVSIVASMLIVFSDLHFWDDALTRDSRTERECAYGIVC